MNKLTTLVIMQDMDAAVSTLALQINQLVLSSDVHEVDAFIHLFDAAVFEARELMEDVIRGAKDYDNN